MILTRIEIRWIYGIKDLIWDYDENSGTICTTSVIPGAIIGREAVHIKGNLYAINVIVGPNESGKSSLLNAIRNVAEGGSISDLRNVNAPEGEKSEIFMMIHHRGEDYKIEKYTTPKGEALSVKRRIGDSIAFEKIKQPPQTFINTLFDKKSLDPLEFCTVDDKKRVDLLLAALNLPFDRDEMWRTIGLKYDDFPAVNEEQHPLREIKDVRQNIFERRTGINTTEKAKRSACEEMKRTIPAEMPPAPEDIELKQSELNGRIAMLEGLKKDIDAEHKAEYAAIHGRKSTAKSELDRKLAELDMRRDSEIERMKREIERQYKELASLEAEAFISIDHECTASFESADERKKSREPEVDTLRNEITELTAEIASMRTASEERTRIEERRRLANGYEAEAESLKGKSDALTAALQALDNYKANMTKDLPIKGLDISDNVIRLNGVPWKDLNTQTQYDVSIQVATLRQRAMGLDPMVIVDGAEQIDPHRFDLLIDRLEAAGVSAWMARVTGIPFAIFSGPGAAEKIKDAERSSSNIYRKLYFARKLEGEE